MERVPIGCSASFSPFLCCSPAAAAAAQSKAPPGDSYKKVSTLVALPDFLPGLGTLYADPATFPPVHSSPTTGTGTW